MNREKGISIYPFHTSFEDNCSYIEKAAHYGFTRAFTCLLSVDTSRKDEIVKEFKETILWANKNNILVIADVAPNVFSDLNISYDDLTFFADLGAHGIRLDLGFTGNEESLMTFNPFDLKIELNMSQKTHYLDTIMDFCPNSNNLLGSHNFYPHRFTGLSREHFNTCTKQFQQYNLRTAAFVKAPSASIGPWEVSDGLCTLEEHRDQSLSYQVKDMFINGNMHTVLISECFASEEELQTMGKINPYLLELEVELINDIPEIEKSIVVDELHYHRGDEGGFVARSTQSRVKYKGTHFKVFNAPKTIKKGDVLIESSLYGTYAGELHIALQDMPNSGRTNVVGRITDTELELIKHIKPWQKFKLYTQQ
ncbi:MAG: DUF871 domain-containing protein [Brevinemataceae bacterium]